MSGRDADRAGGEEGQISIFGSPVESPPADESPPTGERSPAEEQPAVAEEQPVADEEPATDDEPATAASPSGRRTSPAVGNGSPREAEVAPAGSSVEAPISVADLNARAKKVLEGHFPRLWVAGEIANWSRANSGHRYFSLRDDSAQIDCVMWRSDARRLPTEPEEGMEVCALGQVTVYPVKGSYQLVVRSLEARGDGLWRLAFERLKKKLAAEGLLDEERKRALPKVPAVVGVVTSRTGAALRDVISVVRRRAPWTRVLVSDCRVQGDGAGEDVVCALRRLERHGGVDVIIVTRGGGSVEDLWCFNEEPAARAVAECPVPVISAVGHEVDVTITDLVADVRAPTPSAAGELAVPDVVALRGRLRALADGLVAGLRQRTRRGRVRAQRCAERLTSAMSRRLERWDARLGRLSGRLDALSPLRILGRGYAVPLDEEGRVLREIRDFEPGDGFDLRVVDGTVGARVEETAAADGETELPGTILPDARVGAEEDGTDGADGEENG